MIFFRSCADTHLELERNKHRETAEFSLCQESENFLLHATKKNAEHERVSRVQITWHIVMMLFSCFSQLNVGGDCDDFKRIANSSGFSLVDFHRESTEQTSDEMTQFDPIIQSNLEEIGEVEFKRARTVRVLMLMI